MKAYPVENFPNYLLMVMSRYEDVFKIGLQQVGLMNDQDPLVFKTSRSGGHVSFFFLQMMSMMMMMMKMVMMMPKP